MHFWTPRYVCNTVLRFKTHRPNTEQDCSSEPYEKERESIPIANHLTSC